MAFFDVAGLLLLGGLSWLWYDSMKVRDIGMRAVRMACTAEGLQLLDETMSIASLKTARNDDGQLVLQRSYRFEYSDTGNDRHSGSIVMLGDQVMLIGIEAGQRPT